MKKGKNKHVAFLIVLFFVVALALFLTSRFIGAVHDISANQTRYPGEVQGEFIFYNNQLYSYTGDIRKSLPVDPPATEIGRIEVNSINLLPQKELWSSNVEKGLMVYSTNIYGEETRLLVEVSKGRVKIFGPYPPGE